MQHAKFEKCNFTNQNKSCMSMCHRNKELETNIRRSVYHHVPSTRQMALPCPTVLPPGPNKASGPCPREVVLYCSKPWLYCQWFRPGDEAGQGHDLIQWGWIFSLSWHELLAVFLLASLASLVVFLCFPICYLYAIYWIYSIHSLEKKQRKELNRYIISWTTITATPYWEAVATNSPNIVSPLDIDL